VPPRAVTVRLVDASGNDGVTSGRLEVRHEKQWGTVCSRAFDPLDADVACRQMGKGRYGWPIIDGRFGQGTGMIWLTRVACNATTQRLEDCASLGWGVAKECTHAMDVGVVCSDTKNTGDVVA